MFLVACSQPLSDNLKMDRACSFREGGKADLNVVGSLGLKICFLTLTADYQAQEREQDLPTLRKIESTGMFPPFILNADPTLSNWTVPYTAPP